MAEEPPQTVPHGMPAKWEDILAMFHDVRPPEERAPIAA